MRPAGASPVVDPAGAAAVSRPAPRPIPAALAPVAYSAAPTEMTRAKPAETPRAPRSARQRATTPRAAELPDTLAFMQLLWAVDHGLRSRSKQMHHTIGVTGPQRLCLRLIGRRPGTAPSELAAQLHIDRGTLSGILERLVQRGLVRRTPDPDDGRRAQLELTAAGRRYDKETAGTVEAAVRRTLATLPRARIVAARDVLEALSAELTREDSDDA